MKFAIATCFNIPEPDVDEDLTLSAFERRGHEVHLAAWEDQSIDWSDFDAVIIRSTWNYPLQVDAFAEWVQNVNDQTTLLNPAKIILANLNKRYLVDLASCGIPVIPTDWLYPKNANSLQELLRRKSVIKPAIGAGSLDARVFEPNQIDDAIAWLGRQAAHREFMVQPYLNSVNTVGEQSIVVIGSEPSHRIVKHPRFAGQEERVEGPFEVGEFDSLIRNVIEPIKREILYARVDLMMDEEGTWRLSELEVIEPSLFFTQNPQALDMLVDRVEELLS